MDWMINSSQTKITASKQVSMTEKELWKRDENLYLGKSNFSDSIQNVLRKDID